MRDRKLLFSLLALILIVCGIFGAFLAGLAYQRALDSRTEPKACTMEALLCPDGSAVGRDPENNCEFKACPAAEDDNRVCTLEAQMCPDGSYVGRNPKNNCAFDDCPGVSSPVVDVDLNL